MKPYLALGIGFLWVAAAAADEKSLPACHIERSAPVTFSSPSNPDTLLVSVNGDPCYKGVAVISITSKGGEVVYRHVQPFKQLTATQWDDSALDKDAEAFVNYTITKGMQGLSSALPVWTDPKEFYEANYTSVKVSRERYEEIRKLRLPVFYHQTYYEGGRHLVYDQAQKKTIVIMEGGL